LRQYYSLQAGLALAAILLILVAVVKDSLA